MNAPRPIAVKLERGSPDAAKKCEKKGSHVYTPARMIVDPIDKSAKVIGATFATQTRRVCRRCGLCIPK